MKRYRIYLGILFLATACGQKTESDSVDTPSNTPPEPKLTAFYDEAENAGYINETGDTVVPVGKYDFILTDTITTIGFAYTPDGKIMCLDNRGNELFETYNFDNGPDYPEEGLFRIVNGDKIGYADESGYVVIEPQYSCAYPFENGKAKVSFNCTETTEFEMKKWESTDWFYIDYNGNRINE